MKKNFSEHRSFTLAVHIDLELLTKGIKSSEIPKEAEQDISLTPAPADAGRSL